MQPGAAKARRSAFSCVGSVTTVWKPSSGGVRTATVKYGDGERKVVIPEDVPIVAFDPSDRPTLKPGAKVVVNGQRAADGSLTVASVSVGKDGLASPT